MESNKLNKADFLNKYSQLKANNDYRGIAALFREYDYEGNEELKNRALRVADEYEEQADIDDKLLSNASDRQKAAYRFLSNGPVNTMDPSTQDNYYSKPFADAWNAMASSDGYIHIQTHYNLDVTGMDLQKKRIVDEDYLTKFSEGSGIAIDDFKQYGITRGKDGELLIATDNPNKVQIYKGIKAIIDSGDSATLERVLPSKNFDNETFRNNFVQNDYYLGSVIRHPFYSMDELVTDANTQYTDIMSDSSPYILQTVVTGYMGEDDKQLQQAFASGAMDLQTFKEARKLLEEKYNRIMQTVDLTQYQIWAMGEDNNGSHLLQEVKDNIERANLNDEMLLALAEGRLHYSHASDGVHYGTMITIDPKYDKKGNPVEEHTGKRFFVKDLFRSEAENRLREDTQVDAQLKYSKHMSYGHVYRTKEGGRIENWDGSSDTAEYVDNFGNKQIVSKAEILDIIDNDIIERRLIEYYKKATARNSRGHQYTNEAYQVFGSDENNNDLLIDNINKKALQVVAAKYGDPNSEYVKTKAMELACRIILEVNNPQ